MVQYTAQRFAARVFECDFFLTHKIEQFNDKTKSAITITEKHRKARQVLAVHCHFS